MKSDVMRSSPNRRSGSGAGYLAAIAVIPAMAGIAVRRNIVVEYQARRRSPKPLRSFASLGGMTAMQ